MHIFTKKLFLMLLVVSLGCQKETPVPVVTDGDGSSTDNPEENPSTSLDITPNDFLSDRQYDQLIVEILYVEGYRPEAESVDHLEAFLQERLNKPGGITLLQSPIKSPDKTSFSLKELRELEALNRKQKTEEKTLTASLMFVDADYAENQGSAKVLGIAYGSSSMVIFEKTIREFSGGLTQPPVSTLESTVIKHEMAHILGLVNNGTPVQSAHQDEAHGRHCNEKSCLMYYAAETSDIVGNLVGGKIPELDAQCIADLKANGGK